MASLNNPDGHEPLERHVHDRLIARSDGAFAIVVTLPALGVMVMRHGLEAGQQACMLRAFHREGS